MKNKYSFVDTHTHTQFWEEKHFKKLNKNALIISLDLNFVIPKQIILNKETPYLQYAYGLQPFTKYNFSELKNYLYNLENAINNGQIQLLGELGLYSGDKRESMLFKTQLELAKKYDIKSIIHTPSSKNKIKIFNKICKLIDSIGIDHQLLLIDHINGDILHINKTKCYLGLTIQKYGKLSKDECKEIIQRSPKWVNKFIINSDYSNLKDRKQLISEVNTVGIFQKELSQIDESLSHLVTCKNALKFIEG